MSSDTYIPPPSLSSTARVIYWCGPPLVVLLTLLVSPPAIVALPFIALPTFYAIQKHNEIPLAQRANFETCLWSYLVSAVIGMTFAGVCQLVLGYSFLYLFHGDQTMAFLKSATTSPADLDTQILAARAAAAWSWQNIVQRFWMTYVIAGVVEETVKVSAVRFALRRSPPAERQERRHLYSQYAVAVGLGFGIMESLVCLPGLFKSGHGWARIATEVGERIVYGTFAHVLTTTLSSLRMLQNNASEERVHQEVQAPMHTQAWSLLRIIAPPAMYHGTGNFLLMSISATNGHFLWVHPWDAKSLAAMYTMSVGLIVALGLNVQLQWERMGRQ